MNKFAVALLMLPLLPAAAFAQAAPGGDAQAGKALWLGNATQCRNCHGENGQGAFGPDLAGRKLTAAQFKQALRKPWGVMPAFVESQISDSDVLNLVAYFDGMPVNTEPGKWRFEVPANAPHGQRVALTMGCAQCHGPALLGPRSGLGASGGSFEEFKELVYHHTTAYPEHSKAIGERMPPRMRMGNFSPDRLWEPELKAIYDWAKDDLGFRVNVRAALGKGAPAANGVTYTLTVDNPALPEKGLGAEDITIRLVIPADTTVVSATGEGYQGVRMEEQAKANVAVWQVAKLAPKANQTYTITLSKAVTEANNLKGEIRWAKPAMKSGKGDANPIAPAPL